MYPESRWSAPCVPFVHTFLSPHFWRNLPFLSLCPGPAEGETKRDGKLKRRRKKVQNKKEERAKRGRQIEKRPIFQPGASSSSFSSCASVSLSFFSPSSAGSAARPAVLGRKKLHCPSFCYVVALLILPLARTCFFFFPNKFSSLRGEMSFGRSKEDTFLGS